MAKLLIVFSLLIPAFWWHQVSSLSDSVSMNAFFGDAGEDRYVIRIMEKPIWPAFRYWLLNVVEQVSCGIQIIFCYV